MALQKSMTTIGLIGNETFSTSSGVKQGGSTSCMSFTSYIDPTIHAVKSLGPDGWLGECQILLFMDDTVIFATSREKMEQKLNKLKECADNIGMIIHPTKSKYITVNTNDEQPFRINNVNINETKEYVYLGAPIMNNTVTKQIELQLQQKNPHTIKFASFLYKNNDCPFIVKKTVWESAFKAAIFYGCETWLTKDLQLIEKPYLKTVKQLLNVRQTTCSDTLLIDLGISNAKSMVKDKQCKFLKTLLQ